MMTTGTAFQMRIRGILEGTEELTAKEREMVQEPITSEDIEETPEDTFGFHFSTN